MRLETIDHGAETNVSLASHSVRTQHIENWPAVLAREATEQLAREIRACPPGPIRSDPRLADSATNGLLFEQVPEPGRSAE